MNVFVTGATGKVGSRLVPRLLQRGHQVTVGVRDSAKAAALALQGARVIVTDLTQPVGLADTLYGMDAVIHLAAQFRGVDEATAKLSNIGASIALAEAALLADVLEENSQSCFDPWDMIVDTTSIREELNYRPLFPTFYTARDAGAL